MYYIPLMYCSLLCRLIFQYDIPSHIQYILPTTIKHFLRETFQLSVMLTLLHCKDLEDYDKESVFFNSLQSYQIFDPDSV